MSIECTVEAVTHCDKCQSSNIVYKTIFTEPNNIRVMIKCRDCGCFYSLPHLENLAKRTNTTLTHWREKVAARDNYQCRLCGSTENIHVHHIIPVSADPTSEFKYDVNNGITLCHRHHLQAHSNDKQYY